MYLHCRFWGATSRSVVDAGIVGLAHEILPVGEHRESQRVAGNAVHESKRHTAESRESRRILS